MDTSVYNAFIRGLETARAFRSSGDAGRHTIPPRPDNPPFPMPEVKSATIRSSTRKKRDLDGRTWRKGSTKGQAVRSGRRYSKHRRGRIESISANCRANPKKAS